MSQGAEAANLYQSRLESRISDVGLYSVYAPYYVTTSRSQQPEPTRPPPRHMRPRCSALLMRCGCAAVRCGCAAPAALLLCSAGALLRYC